MVSGVGPRKEQSDSTWGMETRYVNSRISAGTGSMAERTRTTGAEAESSAGEKRSPGSPAAARSGAETKIEHLLHLAADFKDCWTSVRGGRSGGGAPVRTGSRRIQAMVETMLREGGARADRLQQPARVGCAS